MDHALQVNIMKELMQQLDDGRNIDAGAQYKLNTAAYVCPDIAAREWETLFRNHPQLIGLSAELPDPGSFLTREDFGTPLLATRDADGKFHAFLNACRHRGARVATEERGQKKLFTCPYHAWSYSNTGALKAVSDSHDFGEIDKQCMNLIELPAMERDGLLWVHPQPNGQLDIDNLLGAELAKELAAEKLGELVHGGDKTLAMNLNWKFANDTFGETYHFGKLHKDTLANLFYGNNTHFKAFGRHHRFVSASRAIDQFRKLPESEWDIKVGGAFVIYYLFPNIQLILSNGVCTLVQIYPDQNNTGRSTTRIRAHFAREVMESAATADSVNGTKLLDAQSAYTGDGAAIQTLESTMELFNSTVEQEDFLMGEYQQQSAESGILKEIVFGRNEPLLQRMHASFREALNLSPMEKLD